MAILERLSTSFFERPVVEVARTLLGANLVRLLNGVRTGGMIIETEAYRGEDDLACHARAGLTKRTAVMYGPPGHAYVYFNYGLHWLLNFVTSPEGFPAAVLLRAIIPTQGLEIIADQRGNQEVPQWCNGPAKICKALDIDGNFNGYDLCSPESELWIEKGRTIPEQWVSRGPRVGIKNVPEPWRSMPWRFLADIPADQHPDRQK
ncbi:MAG: DNA-3-methyladenine glycosylase [Anaerolineaceae bacterium]|nr:DNA-3-methyladenine glycosylase [Anaerolineaceae bacterium]